MGLDSYVFGRELQLSRSYGKVEHNCHPHADRLHPDATPVDTLGREVIHPDLHVRRSEPVAVYRSISWLLGARPSSSM